MTTIYDIAKRAEVSTKTVSRVINGDSKVKLSTRELILEIMREMDFKPNQQARQLRLGNKSGIGLLLEDPDSGYQTRFQSAMLHAAMEAGCYLSVELFSHLKDDWKSHLSRYIKNSNISNIILLPTQCDFGPLRDFLRENNVNCALISPTNLDSDFVSIAMDERQAAREITEYLINLGHRKIAHISGHPDHSASLLRRQGFYEAFEMHNLPRPRDEYIVQGDFLFKTGLKVSEELLKIKDLPTAIFACNDETAAATCSAAHKRGLRIPEDITIVGFDDVYLATAIWPPLTTVRQPYLEMARRAINILSNMRDKNDNDDVQLRHVLPYSIIERESSSLSPRGEI